MSLNFGSEGLARVVYDAAGLLIAYRDDSGVDYLDFQPSAAADVLAPQDPAVMILINSRAGPSPFQAVQHRG